jgi:hypothetical protein
MPNASPKKTANLRIAFSILGLLVLVTLVLVKPVTDFLDGPNTAQSSDAEEYIISAVQMQQAHFEANRQFAQDLMQLPRPQPAQKLYQYQLEIFPGKHQMVAIYAVAQKRHRDKAKLRSLVGLVQAVGEKPDESTEAIICQPPERGMPIVKAVESIWPLVCPGGMKESFRWPKKI